MPLPAFAAKELFEQIHDLDVEWLRVWQETGHDLSSEAHEEIIKRWWDLCNHLAAAHSLFYCSATALPKVRAKAIGGNGSPHSRSQPLTAL